MDEIREERAMNPVMEESLTREYAERNIEPMVRVKEYKPKKQEVLREYEIGIRFLSVGCVIRIGCKEIPFRNIKEAMEELNKYVENPYEESKRWNDIFDGEE